MVHETELGGYHVVGRLAVGGMAEVYQAKPLPQTQRSVGEPDDVVLKRLLPSYRNDNAYVKHFVDEAKLTVKLKHPNIVRTYRCFKAGADYLMVQELVSGRSLAFMQDAFVQAGLPMPLSASTYIVHCLLQALDYVHHAKVGEGSSRVVHRDVSPANVLLSVGGDVKLTDFGVAEVDGVSQGELGALRGTISYMSPEGVLGHAVDSRADLFSVGVILWELYTNQRLFHGATEMEMMHKVRDARAPSVQRFNPDVPDMAAQVVRKALFADRNMRFQSAAEMAQALELTARRFNWPLTVEALKPLLGGSP